MRHPLWIVNSTLLLFFIGTLLFLGLSHQKPVKWVSLDVKTESYKLQNYAAVDTKKIYENDLFNTYREEKVAAKDQQPVLVMPQPPQSIPARAPSLEQPSPSTPLNVTLKGIMLFNDGSADVAIIADNATNKEANYVVGQRIEDAEIIRILFDRIVVLRADGQQEIVYVSAKDMQDDPLHRAQQNNWASVLKLHNESDYFIDHIEFVRLVPSVAYCLELFDLTVAYDNGKSVGCRVGTIEPESLPKALGFEKDDMITKVNGVSTVTLANRMTIYKAIADAQE